MNGKKEADESIHLIFDSCKFSPEKDQKCPWARRYKNKTLCMMMIGWHDDRDVENLDNCFNRLIYREKNGWLIRHKKKLAGQGYKKAAPKNIKPAKGKIIWNDPRYAKYLENRRQWYPDQSLYPEKYKKRWRK